MGVGKVLRTLKGSQQGKWCSAARDVDSVCVSLGRQVWPSHHCSGVPCLIFPSAKNANGSPDINTRPSFYFAPELMRSRSHS